MSERKIPDPERLKLWVRSGGRCQICRRHLLEGQLGYRELTFGQAAHIVGQKATAKSPRGLDELLTDEERDNADNLMLICDDEHSEIDKWGSRDAFTVAFLRELKRKHEDQVFLATSFGEYNRTTPIRMVGWLRGSPAEVGRDAVATAVMASAGRMPQFDLSTRNMLEIDLRGLPGEDGPSPEYYAAACQLIDRAVKTKAAEAVASEDIIHLSVFAFARLPLLVYLGAQLGDQVPIDVYQKHRSTGDWKWPEPDGTATFTLSAPDPEPASCEATLVINVSGTIHRDELPHGVRDLPVFELAVDQLAHSWQGRGHWTPSAMLADGWSPRLRAGAISTSVSSMCSQPCPCPPLWSSGGFSHAIYIHQFSSMTARRPATTSPPSKLGNNETDAVLRQDVDRYGELERESARRPRHKGRPHHGGIEGGRFLGRSRP